MSRVKDFILKKRPREDDIATSRIDFEDPLHTHCQKKKRNPYDFSAMSLREQEHIHAVVTNPLAHECQILDECKEIALQNDSMSGALERRIAMTTTPNKDEYRLNRHQELVSKKKERRLQIMEQIRRTEDGDVDMEDIEELEEEDELGVNEKKAKKSLEEFVEERELEEFLEMLKYRS